jgi:hypothetical protein
MLHDDHKIFANPERFIPDRWLGEEGARLLSDWVPFQEGSRRCIANKYGCRFRSDNFVMALANFEKTASRRPSSRF